MPDEISLSLFLGGMFISMALQFYLWGGGWKKLISFDFWFLSIFGVIFSVPLLKDSIAEYKSQRFVKKVITDRENKLKEIKKLDIKVVN